MQAKAARVEPNARFNPVLLKPKGGNQLQIVLMGKSFADYDYHDYSSRYVPQLIPYITSALDELLAENDLVIIEGVEVRQRLIYYNLTYRIYLWQNIFIARPF